MFEYYRFDDNNEIIRYCPICGNYLSLNSHKELRKKWKYNQYWKNEKLAIPCCRCFDILKYSKKWLNSKIRSSFLSNGELYQYILYFEFFNDKDFLERRAFSLPFYLLNILIEMNIIDIYAERNRKGGKNNEL